MEKPFWRFGADMSGIIDWFISTPLGLAAIVIGLVVLFTLIALNSERKTRKLYPDHSRRGTKAVAKAKAKKRAEAAAKTAKTATTSAEAADIPTKSTKSAKSAKTAVKTTSKKK
jgi:predicted lipid-binding transport protein (Tim44 family)